MDESLFSSQNGQDLFSRFVFVPVCDWNASVGCKVRKPCINLS